MDNIFPQIYFFKNEKLDPIEFELIKPNKWE